jgi:hypothetical protein
MPTRKPKTPEPPQDDAAESRRFIDMAREVSVDESPEAFDRAFEKVILPAPQQPKAEQEK